MGSFRWVTDVGLTGPDKGKGGKYLFVPPGYSGSVPSEGYFLAKPRTNKVLIFYPALRRAQPSTLSQKLQIRRRPRL
jgi:hypothetical protein